MKLIKGYENYGITEDGRVYSYKRNKFLKPCVKKDGYLAVCLSNKGETKTFLIHRLVAAAFIPNPDNLPQVNHKDENKVNNNVDNLEWCDAKYNANYGTRKQRVITNHKKPIIATINTMTEDGELIKQQMTFDSIIEGAEYFNIPATQISSAIKRNGTAHDIKFELIKED